MLPREDVAEPRPGDRLPVVLNGKLRQLAIVGIASSPEYVMAIAPGSLSSDPERMGRLICTASTSAGAESVAMPALARLPIA